MMNIRKFTLLLLCSIAVLFTACKGKGDDPTPKQQAIKNLSRAWKVNSVTGNIGTQDSYKDLVLTLTSTGTFTMTGFENIAAENRPAREGNGSWSLTDDAKTLTFTTTSGNNVVTVTSSSATNFIFNFQGKEAPKLTDVITVEYNMVPK